MDFNAILMIVLFTLVIPGAWVLITPLAKRLSREAERPSAPPPEVLAELERLNARVAELEERVDFAERLLAQHREPDRLPGGAQ